MAFFCGTASFSRASDDDPWLPSTPRSSSRRKHGGSSNPYSDRGLEKFSMVLADLEARREKIMAAAGSQGAAIIQFAYSSSDDWVPVVVRPRERRPSVEKPGKGGGGTGQAEKRSNSPEERPAPPAPSAELREAAPDRTVKKSISWKAREGEGGGRWKPSSYLPVAVVLVLLCLALFGRAFAIFCTSIWWYSLPAAAAKGRESRDVRKPLKKEYGRRASDRRLGGAAATSGGGDAAAPSAQERRASGLEGLASPRRHHAAAKTGSW